MLNSQEGLGVAPSEKEIFILSIECGFLGLF